MSRRCTSSLALTTPTGESLKIPFSSRAFYTLGPTGELRRIRHRSQLPVDPTGQGLLIVGLDPAQSFDPAHLRDLLALGASSRLATFAPDVLVGTTNQARRFAAGPEGFLTTTSLRAVLGEGGPGWRRDAQSELFALLSNDRLSETMYESLDQRSARMRELIATLTESDPQWVLRFARVLRAEHKVRSAATALAVEAALAGHPQARQIFAVSLTRPDEPGQALRYFFDTYPDRPLPSALKKGLADAATRLYSEQSVLDFDVERARAVRGVTTNDTRAVRFADVVALTHPRPKDAAQSALFAHLMGSKEPDATTLPLLATARRLRTMSDDQKRSAIKEAHREVTSVLAAGYAAAGRYRGDLSIFNTQALLTWRPRREGALTPANELRLRQERLDAAVTALSAARQSAVADGYARAARKLRRLMAHQANDAYEKMTLAWKDAPDTHREAELSDSLAARQGKIVELRNHISTLQSPNALKQAKAELREAHQSLRDLQSDLRADNAPTSEVMEVALVNMSYKETLVNLTKLSVTSPEARAFVADRLADPKALASSNVQLSDLMVASTALSRLPQDNENAVKDLRNGLDRAVTNTAQAALGDLGDRRILVLVDGSGSMSVPVSLRRGDERASAYEGLRRSELAAMFASMISVQGHQVDVVTYDTEGQLVDLSSTEGVTSKAHEIARNTRGGGTDTWGVLMDWYNDHDIVVVLTDEQTSWSPFESLDDEDPGYWRPRPRSNPRRFLPASAKVITCNLAGDLSADAPSHPNHLSVAGASPVVLEGIAAAASGQPWAAGV